MLWCWQDQAVLPPSHCTDKEVWLTLFTWEPLPSNQGGKGLGAPGPPCSAQPILSRLLKRTGYSGGGITCIRGDNKVHIKPIKDI